MESYVYLMKDVSLGYHKIGMSDTPHKREKTLMAQKPAIELIGIGIYKNRKTAMSIEKYLHREYKEYRIRGEWFSLDNNQIQNILFFFSNSEFIYPVTEQNLTDFRLEYDKKIEFLKNTIKKQDDRILFLEQKINNLLDNQKNTFFEKMTSAFSVKTIPISANLIKSYDKNNRMMPKEFEVLMKSYGLDITYNTVKGMVYRNEIEKLREVETLFLEKGVNLIIKRKCDVLPNETAKTPIILKDI